jgi:mucin-2
VQSDPALPTYEQPMRKLALALLLFGLGLGAAVLVASPGAGARGLVDGTLTGSVGTSGNPNAFVISLSASSVAPGTYEFDITDYATMHNFDLIDPNGNSVDKTSVSGTGSSTWTVTLSPGTYTYRCDVHASMHGTLTVTGGTTSTSTSTSTSTTTTTGTTTTGTTTTGTTTTGTTTTGTTTTGTTTTTTTPTTTAQTTTTTTTTTGSGPLRVHIASVHVKGNLVLVTVRTNQVTRAVATLTRKGKSKRLARAAGDTVPGKLKLQLRLRPRHALKRGSYVVTVKVSCCGTSTTSKKTIRISS